MILVAKEKNLLPHAKNKPNNSVPYSAFSTHNTEFEETSTYVIIIRTSFNVIFVPKPVILDSVNTAY